ncbi:MAG: DHA2 family efflux MFS transporter permease subunit [Sporomusaceae bacterium]|nr:DHA2 family efflux MFS transporter permease subunit [Sporomusaceae bacterium]
MVEAAFRPKNPMLVATVVSIAAFMEVLDTTIANVALSQIAGSIGASSEESTWILTSYLVSNGIVLPLSGWLSGLMGRKNFFIACILGFTLTSFLCGIANSLTLLIVFRLLQGLAGGGLQPAQQAIIKDSFPPEKLGMAFAITGITTVLAPIIGPALGGYITDNYNWRWIFFMNVPVGLLAAFLVKLLVEDPPSAQKRPLGSIDYIGLSLIALGLGALQIVLDKGQQEDWFDSSFIIVFSVIAAVGLITAVFWLLQQKHPIVKLQLFKIPSFGMPCVMMFFVGFALYSGTTLLPMLVQTYFGYNATLSGLLLSPGGLAVLTVMPLVGRLVNKVQAKYLVSFGMAIMALGMWATGQITPQTDYWTFALVRVLQTLGLPFLFVPVTTLAFSKISREESSNASAIISLMRNLGGSVGIAIVTNYLIHRQQVEQAYLAERLTASDWGYSHAMAALSQKLTQFGIPSGEVSQYAMGKIYQELIHQAGILAFCDAYHFVAAVSLCLAVAALFMPNNKNSDEINA